MGDGTMEQYRNHYRRWAVGTVVLMFLCIVAVCVSTVIIDPFFHYHAPAAWMNYFLHNERYQNDGILKHFDYDAVITGTSMTQNFKTSEMDEIFGVHSVKTSFSGAYYKEINDRVKTAAASNTNLKCVVRGLDYDSLLLDKDKEKYEDYPDYLYDDILWNDVPYLLNKEVLYETMWVLARTAAGKPRTTFDEYSSWEHRYEFGKEAVDNSYTRLTPRTEKEIPLTGNDIEMLRANIEQNVTSAAEQNPDITFYYFFTPYSIYYWDSLNQNGTMRRQLDAERIAIEMMLPYENIRLYSFFDEFDMVCDLDNYKDSGHYSGQINSRILEWMHEGEHLLTKENYEEYCKKTRDFYLSYDYDGLFEE